MLTRFNKILLNNKKSFFYSFRYLSSKNIDPVLIVGANIPGFTLGKCLEYDGIPFDIIRSGNESSIENASYETLHKNAIDVFHRIGLWKSISKFIYPINEINIDIAPRKTHPLAKRLVTIPLVSQNKEYSACSVSTLKLKKVLGCNTIMKKITKIQKKKDGTFVTFQGGHIKKYSIVIMTDGTINPFLVEFKKRRPAEFRNEFSSVIIPKTDYDPDTISEFFAFGKRLTIIPVSENELQVTFHQLREQVPSSPLARLLPVSTLIDEYTLNDSSEATDSIQNIIQRILDLPKSKKCFYSNPRIFLKNIPMYHEGKILTYACRKEAVDIFGITNSYQIEECYRIAKLIAVNLSTENIETAIKSFDNRKEKRVKQFSQKITDFAIYQNLRSYSIIYFKSILFHQILGGYKSKYKKATDII